MRKAIIMIWKSILSLVLALAGLTTLSGPALARPFTATDLATQERLSDAHVSGDGRFVAYNVRSTDWEANRGWNALWVMDRAAPEAPPRLIRDHEPQGLSPRWSADGHWLYFLSARTGTAQVWRVPADSGEARVVTGLPLEVAAFRPSPNGSSLVVAINIDPDCATLACGKAHADAASKVKSTGMIYNTATPRFWDSYLDGRFVGLFAITITDDALASDGVALTPGYRADILSRPEGDDAAFTISPDGQTVVFAARPSGSAQGLGDPTALYRVPLDGTLGPVRLDVDAQTSDSAPVFSPDGTVLAYLSRAGSTFTDPRGQMKLRNLKTGVTRDLTQGFERSLDSLAWSPDGKTLYGLAEDLGQIRIYAVDVAKGEIKPLTGDGHVTGISLGKNTLIYSRETLGSPSQVYDMTKNGPRQLTHVGEAALAQTPMSPFEPFSFSGWNGETVHGYVVKPAGFQPGHKYPVAFLIHGGPHGSFGNAWSYRWNPQVWAGMGYAVVMIDFHGSSGYGEAFAKSIIGHWGDRPLEDLQIGWAHALATYKFLDGDRACALGGSYGGFMVTWIAGNWPAPWKCLVDHDGVFDVRLMSYSTDIPGFQQAQNDAVSWAKPEAAERFNPVDHVADWHVPLLVVHGGRDLRVPLDQGMGAYGAAQLRHVPSQLLYFPDENHWVLKPQNSVQWYSTVEAWMKRWVPEPGH